MSDFKDMDLIIPSKVTRRTILKAKLADLTGKRAEINKEIAEIRRELSE